MGKKYIEIEQIHVEWGWSILSVIALIFYSYVLYESFNRGGFIDGLFGGFCALAISTSVIAFFSSITKKEKVRYFLQG